MSLGFACVLSEDALLYFWCEINSFVLWSCVVDLMFPITRKHKRIVIKLVENKTTKRERQTGGEGAFVCVQFAVHLNRHNSLWKSVWHEPCEFMLQSELAVCAFARFHFFFFFNKCWISDELKCEKETKNCHTNPLWNKSHKEKDSTGHTKSKLVLSWLS